MWTPETSTACLLALVLVLPAAAVRADEPARGEVRLDADVVLLPHGDGLARVLIDFSPVDYTNIKAQNPNAQRFLRDFSSDRADFELGEGSQATYDDVRSAVRLELEERGAVFHRGGGLWELAIERGTDFVNVAPNASGGRTATFYATGTWPGDIRYRGQVRYELPTGAEEPAFDAARRTLRYRLPVDEGSGPANLDVRFTVRERLMTAIYKVYGLGTEFSAMWVGKSVLRNAGASILRDVRVRYRLASYSEWSPWQRFPELVPGQTAVANYYPVLDRSIATLTSNTPANLEVEWRYTDRDGHTHEDSDGRRIVLLGVHEFVFSNLMSGQTFGGWHDATNNAPFVAAWCSRDDLIVKQFAAMANRAAGGVGATTSAENQVKVLRAIYELMVANGFSYQFPPALLDRSVSFDVQSVQNVKFPRDVIRDKSGTCIDLAILYASMANALGIDSYLALVPGHCFPVFSMPGGGYVGVEATGVLGGLAANEVKPFEAVFQLGNQQLAKWIQDGRIHLLHLQDLWTRGISNPELPPLPADTLTSWGLRELAAAERTTPVGPGPQPNGDHDVPPPPQDLGGRWSCTVTQQLTNGITVRFPLTLAIQQIAPGSYAVRAEATVSIPTPFGAQRMHIVEEGRATQRGTTLTLHFQSKVATDLDGGYQEMQVVDRGSLELQDGRLVGTVGNELAGFVHLALTR